MGRIVPVGIALFGAFWAYQGWFNNEIWVNKGPGGGFLPFVIGMLTVILSLFEIFKNEPSDAKIEKKHVIPVIATLVMIAVFEVFGMILTFGLFVIAWMTFLEKYPIRQAAMIGISTTAVVYFIFKYFLQVPFPTGFLGI
ncbi:MULTISPECIES: tripartite tricarboxylate transporter TctB family protein [unclassified Paenibacillus]|uniref:tripartite tricarboxylate transporter TctB family protein n=1 Tax=unclassified Paenibacillus TaxID=185978 RepID=UPI001AE2742D|nr:MULTISPECIES: tripartite tricarboxylate transporter TctB family protein [unclassified Paenibacillus]MBP1156949.1 putative membrane protein [Paenibacillus sp. PvP091]MBP1172312.1 putative membrane protein [Paenibacillus sp. PvR098]MBP2438693.1 putative membrane protein [Paenibacillus sp. PvP052]